MPPPAAPAAPTRPAPDTQTSSTEPAAASGACFSGFTDSRLQYLAQQLGRAYWRMGGTFADSLVYDVGGGPPPHAHPTGGRPYHSMDGECFDAFLGFAAAVDFRVVFGLNALYGRNISAGRTAWDPSNAAALLEYASSHNETGDLRLSGFELGNEPNCYSGKGVASPWNQDGASNMASDFLELRTMIDKLEWAHRPLIVGPDTEITGDFLGRCGQHQDKEDFFNFFGTFVKNAAPALDAVSWHYYPMVGRSVNATAEDLVTPAFLNRVRLYAPTVAALKAKYAPHAQLWIDETASFWGGGKPGVSDRAASGFWYIDQLGYLASQAGQHDVFARQTLVQREGLNNYGLIQLNSDGMYTPNPDYFTALLWKRLMGSGVLHTSVEDSAGSLASDGYVRAYAHAATPTERTAGLPSSCIVISNMLAQDATVTVQLPSTTPAGPTRTEYHLTAESLTAAEISLNGTPLRLDAATGKLPPLAGKVKQNGPAGSPVVVTLAARSYVFVALSG